MREHLAGARLNGNVEGSHYSQHVGALFPAGRGLQGVLSQDEVVIRFEIWSQQTLAKMQLDVAISTNMENPNATCRAWDVDGLHTLLRRTCLAKTISFIGSQ